MLQPAIFLQQSFVKSLSNLTHRLPVRRRRCWSDGVARHRTNGRPEHLERHSSLRTWEDYRCHTLRGHAQQQASPSHHHRRGVKTASTELSPENRSSRGLTHQQHYGTIPGQAVPSGRSAASPGDTANRKPKHRPSNCWETSKLNCLRSGGTTVGPRCHTVGVPMNQEARVRQWEYLQDSFVWHPAGHHKAYSPAA